MHTRCVTVSTIYSFYLWGALCMEWIFEIQIHRRQQRRMWHITKPLGRYSVKPTAQARRRRRGRLQNQSNKHNLCLSVTIICT